MVLLRVGFVKLAPHDATGELLPFRPVPRTMPESRDKPGRLFTLIPSMTGRYFFCDTFRCLRLSPPTPSR